jgi:catechol 2,3-dioxygenase-like lactoylglutathione lyase family enzyme
MKSVSLFLLVAMLVPWTAAAQERPPITGVAHYAIYTSDVEKARAFYKGMLGFEEVFDLKNKDGSFSMTFFKVNERQYIEVFPETAANSDRLNHIALETPNAEAMRVYLKSKGIKVPDSVPTGRIGNRNFNVKDPSGHTVEFVEYRPEGWSIRDKGKALGSQRLSTRMMHVGIIVQELGPTMAFYRDVLGFNEFWRGSRDETRLQWINMRVPNGEDYIEFMLHDPVPEPTKRGSAHHICLEVADLQAMVPELQKRAAATGYTKPIELRTGVNRRRLLNLFDHDGTRTELMEPRTVDGVPPTSSRAPWPK